MANQPHILYCRCAYWQRVPDGVKDKVLAALASSGAAFEAVADLCGLAARGDPRLAEWARRGDLRIVACQPRAVKWLFHAAGADLDAGAADVLNMVDQPADEIVRDLLGERADEVLARLGDDGSATAAAAVEKMDIPQSPDWVPWFPVIDYDRCVACGQCASFCLFGVFSVDGDGRVRVTNPDGCKTNCPACARICPQLAIVFPKYPEGPVSGTEVDEEAMDRQKLAGDLRSQLSGDVYAVLRQRTAAGVVRPSPEDLAKIAQQVEIPRDVLMSLNVAPPADPPAPPCSCAPAAPCEDAPTAPAGTEQPGGDDEAENASRE